MSDPTTTISTPGATGLAESSGTEGALALMIAWSAVEPHRAGEIAILPEGRSYVLGRGEPSQPPSTPVLFVRQRPGESPWGGPIAGPSISREQIRLRPQAGALVVENVGRCPLVVGGMLVAKSIIVPGDTLLLKNQLLLLCTRRLEHMPVLQSFPRSAIRAFGEPDAFGMVGESPAAWQIREDIAWSAQLDAHVLVAGPSGTGKELAARATHALSRRSAGPFVARNAATFPSGLIDAELFGNSKNYPNHGMAERAGLVGKASGGTLFLDEIGELPQELQAHLLRVLDAGGEYHRLGDALPRRADLRLIGATNRPLRELKHDLAARLPLRITLPGLDAHRDDIPLLARARLREAASENAAIAARFFETGQGGGLEPRVDLALIDGVLKHSYKTHVRELDALLLRAMMGSAGPLIASPRDPPVEQAPSSARSEDPDGRNLDEIRVAIRQHDGNLSRAAKALGFASRYALYRVLKKHGIEPRTARDEEE